MENYLMLDGKKYELSPDLVNALRSVDPVPEKQNPFARVKLAPKNIYFAIDETGDVYDATDYGTINDNNRFAIANYCTDRSLMEQRAMHETLSRLLWRYSEEHGGSDSDWDSFKTHFKIYRNMMTSQFEIDSNDTYKFMGTVYFSNKKTARAAIEEVIKPFMAEHPDFVW